MEPLSDDATGTSEDVLRVRVGQHRRNRWIPFEDVESARLRRGIASSRLAVSLKDGSRVKLLWLKQDPAYEVLDDLLGNLLGEQLRRR